MRVSNRNARADTSGKHNDRNFDLEKAPHINRDKVHENKYYTYNDERNMSFRDIELEFYHNHFEPALDHQNEKYRKSRHKEKIRTVEQYYASKRTMPEDKILQIGDINEHASKEDLWECALEYKDKFEEIYGDNCKILDMALHMDEATPHVHVRRVWIAQDDRGNEIVSQEKALQQMGILPPDPQKETNRYNNAKMTFTQTDIELFKGICFEHGLDIEMEPSRERRGHLNIQAYKEEQKLKDYDEIEQTISNLATFVKENPYLINAYADELEEAEEKSLAERNKVLVDIMIRAYESLHGQIQIDDKRKRFEQFIAEEGLMDEYDEWFDEKSQEFTEEKGLSEKYADRYAQYVKVLEAEKAKSEDRSKENSKDKTR